MITGFHQETEKLVIGLMSGTSLDGVDAALVQLAGSGLRTKVKLLAFTSLPYEQHFREQIKELCNVDHSSVDKICSMNFRLAERFAKAAQAVADQASLSMEQIDFISSHGQTVWHIPELDPKQPELSRSTLQLGDLSIIAQRTGRPVVGDFRPADMAAGGQGAPLVPYGDLILFRDAHKGRILQNIGGIGNCTVLPAGCQQDDVIAFDTGPGNMIVDQIVQTLSAGEQLYDSGGQWAASGTPDKDMVQRLMEHPYFQLPAPKSTGREVFGVAYATKFLEVAAGRGLSQADMVATATWFTAVSIAHSYEKLIFPNHDIDEIIISGGGAHNVTLMKMINDLLPGNQVTTSGAYGLIDDAKEAVIFAILGNDFMHGVANNMPSATGASKAVVMGKLALG
ncbi:anhydro-N-acetylmuramic acid kinase [Paenibacillus sp. Marseille-Q4541]|uniref:anhydro-N-acetylmuramic acid kinase n=1 Tax=Paenibacillus sp. Marseille-Q4541 TaxID=2831522 RepID=UPI001BA99759|nr:anhydro-N-acetylmuramic acid kinase [Paenibacillus sp. Marseille-Q4541]